MRVIAATLFAAFFIAACQTPCPAPATEAVTRSLTCEDGSALTVIFSRNPDLARIEQEGYAPLTLPARIAGSGYNYTGSGAELRQRGAEITWTRPGAAQTSCSAAGGAPAARSSELPRQAMSVGRASRCPGDALANNWPRITASAA